MLENFEILKMSWKLDNYIFHNIASNLIFLAYNVLNTGSEYGSATSPKKPRAEARILLIRQYVQLSKEYIVLNARS